MDSNKEIKKVFELFNANNFEEAQELNNQILEVFPNNMYAKRYAGILVNKIKSNKKPSSGKTTKVGWKSLKCPHCVAKIPFSGLTEWNRKQIKIWKYSNLEIKCPYCHTKFILQKIKANSILGLKIGDIANIKWKKYRVTGYVQYTWRWYEDNYSGWVKYLEWLLLWEDNKYKYFSEWSSNDDWVWTNEFELSEKYIPKQIWKINYITNLAEIDWDKKYSKEKNKIRVVSVYWENAKNTTIWEKVEIFDFWDIIIEKESSGSQKEATFYKTTKLSWNDAAKIFWKEYSNIDDLWKKIMKKFGTDNGWLIIFLIIIWFNFVSFIPGKYIFFWIFSIIFFTVLFIFKDKFWKKLKIILFWLLWIPIFSFLIFQPIFNSFLENKQSIELNKIVSSEKIELKFKDSSIMKERKISSTRYDYGGIKTYYEKNKWLKFSVKTKEDKEILKKIQELKNDEYFDNSENKIVKMFNWDLYKLK